MLKDIEDTDSTFNFSKCFPLALECKPLHVLIWDDNLLYGTCSKPNRIIFIFWEGKKSIN